MELSVNIDTTELQRKIQAQADAEVNRIAGRVLHSHFGNLWGDKGGIGYERIKKQLEDLLLSDAMNAQIEAIVAKHWNEILEEAVIATLKRKAAKESQIALIGAGVKRID